VVSTLKVYSEAGEYLCYLLSSNSAKKVMEANQYRKPHLPDFISGQGSDTTVKKEGEFCCAEFSLLMDRIE